MMTQQTRLDAAESIWFSRELETINKRLYETEYPANKARTLIPDEAEARGCGPVYTWRMIQNFGKAKVLSNLADDLPKADISGQESSAFVKYVGQAYDWTIMDIKESARTGKPLEMSKANAARLAVDNSIDEMLALGKNDGVAVGPMLGLLNQTNTTAFVAGTKTAGGKTWVKGTPDEISADVGGAIGAIKTALKGANAGGSFDRFQVVIPDKQFIQIATTRLGDGSDTTILQFILKSNPFVSGIDSWARCAGAGAGATDRMAIYPKDPLVLGGVVAEDFTIMPPEQRNLAYVVNAYARCGGVVCRYPVALSYVDGI